MRPLAPIRPSVTVSGEHKQGIRHVPALDGLRGLAIVGVLLFHGGHLIGGYLGVDLFFVLSGFLITSLLLAESTASGSVGLGGFWARRARRLLPALGGVLLGVALYALVFADPTELVRIRGDALATIGYGANWRAVFAHQDYWALFTTPSPLEHTWSLAIEEQFYLVWPLVFVGLLAWWKRSTPKAVLTTSLIGACVSTLLMVVLYSSSNTTRVYYGTDTRAGGILLGAALAAWLALRGPVSSRLSRIAVEAGGVIGVAVLAVAWSSLTGQSRSLYRGGFLLCALAVVAVLAAATHPRPGPIAQALSFKPLRLLGLISYGVYLWHWPVDVVLNERRAHLGGWGLFALQTAVTLVIAVLSYRLLEQPIRRGALSARQWFVLTPAVAAALVLVLVASTLGAKTEAVASAGDAVGAAVLAAHAAPSGTEKVMIVGDSVALHLGEAITQMRADPPIVALNASLPGCNFPANITEVRYPGLHWKGSPCSGPWPAAVERFRPDVVVVIFAGAGDGEVRLGGKWVRSCSSAYDSNFAQGLRQAISTLGARGAQVVLSTGAYNRRPFTKNVDRFADCNNEVRRHVSAATGTPLIDLFSRICPKGNCHTTENGVTLRPDGLHYEKGGARIVAEWLLRQIRASPKPIH